MFLRSRLFKLLKPATVMLVITYGMVEFLLYALDPSGILQLYETNRRLLSAMVPDETSHYRLPQGRFSGNGWTATVNAQGRRHVPASDYSSDCVVVFLGDSFTFGHGVNDDDTLPNLYAQDHDALVINAGMFGYGAAQINHT